MKRKYILFLICSFFLGGVSAQTLEQARTLFTKGEYEQAKPVFKKYTKSQPSNGNYNYWYGACCYETGEKKEAQPYLEKSAARKYGGRVELMTTWVGKTHIQKYDENGNLFDDGWQPFTFELFVFGSAAALALLLLVFGVWLAVRGVKRLRRRVRKTKIQNT